MSQANFHQSVRGARLESPIGFIGQFSRTHDFRSITGIAEHPQANQVWTIAIPAAPDNAEAYSVTVDGVAATYTTDASATQTELGDGLEAAFNASPPHYSKYSAAYSAGTLTLTARYSTVDLTPTRAGGTGASALGAPSEATAPAAAEVVSFGRVCISDGVATDLGSPKVFVATTADLTAQVISLTFAGDTASYYHGSIDVNGRRYVWGGVVWDTNNDTTCTAIAAAINAVMPAETVLAASVGADGGVITLTAEVEGAEFEADAHAQGHASAEVTKAYTTGPSVSTSLKRAMVGISVRRLDVENQTVDGDDPAYAANQPVEVATRGTGILQRDTTETWVRGDEVYVSMASATKGRVYDTAGTDRVWLPSSRIVIDRSENSTTSDGVGVIRLDMGA